MKERGWVTRRLYFAEAYWNNRNHPSKEFLVEMIAAFSPIHSILEVRCYRGANLYLIVLKTPIIDSIQNGAFTDE